MAIGDRGASEDTWTETITAISSLDVASIMGESATSEDNDQTYPRGAITLLLASTTSVELKRSATESSQNYRFSVVEWPIAPLNPMETMSPSDTLVKNQNKLLVDTFGMTDAATILEPILKF